MRKIQLGHTVEDKITHFKGIATARLEDIIGTVDYKVMPAETDRGRYPKPEWIPESHLIYVDEGVTIEKIKPELGFTRSTDR